MRRPPELGGRSALPDPDPRLLAAVVVPARDEQARIEACLLALTGQRGVAPRSYEVIVILDGCRDDTASIVAQIVGRASQTPLHAVALPVSQGVGRARRHGMDLACERLLGLGKRGGLIASTDADSVVADDWLACQLALASSGASAIGGLIELDADESGVLAPQALTDRERRSVERMRAVFDEHPREGTVQHHQFSGASLALTAETYRRCGGLPVRAALEDEALEREL